MEFFERTTGCGQIKAELVGKTITLCGWIQRRRDHGGLTFVDLRDRTGIMQVVFNPDFSQKAHELAHELRSEYVISVTGKVVERTPSTVNKELPTGAFELQVNELIILNKARTLPFALEDADQVEEELRLVYRYLDLRRPLMHERIKMRHQIVYAMREFLNGEGFYEIETPVLTKNTAEGAREFLVPSRIHKGSFYALPQSPQLYKQLLMAGGMERYFQIARCFRDEDLRADRQPEFTQLDIEMSFIKEGDIQSLIERLLKHLFKKLFNRDLQLPLQRMAYDEAYRLYGCDKPDLRFGMPIHDITSAFSDTTLSFMKTVLDKGGKVGALHVSGHQFTRSELEHWVSTALKNGAKGLVWIKFGENDSVEAPIAKFLPADFKKRIEAVVGKINTGDTIFLIASTYKEAWAQLGKLRLQLGHELNIIPLNEMKLLWVTDFPLLEYDEDSKRWQSVHHPFTRPQEGWEKLEPAHIKARSYDIVLNGVELGGGSIRIHEPELQKRIFDYLGFDEEAMRSHFGFLFDAQELGFPPHGGIALGVDRFVMLLLGCASIRDVIAFPKTQSMADPMMHAPTPVAPTKLKDYDLEYKPSQKIEKK
jgi:aspartyl-tRNA synthetase